MELFPLLLVPERTVIGENRRPRRLEKALKFLSVILVIICNPQRPVAFRPILTDGLALSTEPILPEQKDMSKGKPDRAISNCILEFPPVRIRCMFLSQINTFRLSPL